MMKRLSLKLLLFALALAWTLAACDKSSTSSEGSTEASSGETGSSGTEAAEEKPALTTIKFDTTFHDFGTVTEGDKVTFDYHFTNTGTNPLKITKVKPSCGCTSPSHTTEPVPPGGRGHVRLQFDSANKNGETRKSATVIANTDPRDTKLEYKALVNPKP